MCKNINRLRLIVETILIFVHISFRQINLIRIQGTVELNELNFLLWKFV